MPRPLSFLSQWEEVAMHVLNIYFCAERLAAPHSTGFGAFPLGSLKFAPTTQQTKVWFSFCGILSCKPCIQGKNIMRGEGFKDEIF